MHQQLAVAEIEQQILATPRDVAERAPDNTFRQIRRHRVAQRRIAHDHIGDPPAPQFVQQAAARDFDFRQLGHGNDEIGKGGGTGSRACACRDGENSLTWDERNCNRPF
jgi:hypothetical protein